MNLENHVIEKDYFLKLNDFIKFNYQIADFYMDMFKENKEEKFYNKSGSVASCAKYWDINYYQEQAIKDITRVCLCKDKFCFNCQSMLAVKRQTKFSPILDSFKEDYKICHFVLTVPNCDSDELLPLLDKMYLKFPQLMRYFNGVKKVKGINFLKYGYGGAVRGLEVTRNPETKQFHPHFHCMILFSKNINLKQKHVNSFSYDNGNLVRKFSDVEILIQKIWYLLMNDIRVNKKNIDELQEGYSVMLEDSEGYYHECFKYACKGAFDIDKGVFIYDEFVFRVLYEALYCRRMIQGYGKLHNFNDLDSEILEVECYEDYLKLITELSEKEKPLPRVEQLDDIINQKSCKYISKSNLKRLILDNKEEVLSKYDHCSKEELKLCIEAQKREVKNLRAESSNTVINLISESANEIQLQFNSDPFDN